MEDWETNTSVINETVLTVRDFLMAHHEKSHIGTDEVRAFLGGGWARTTIDDALATIRDEKWKLIHRLSTT